MSTNVVYRNITNFQILREIFWKGDIIVNKRGTRAYHLVDAYIIVEDTVLGKPPKSFLRIIAEYVDFQGDRFGAVKYRPKIPEFVGVKYIKDLPFFPLKYHPNATKLAQRLVDRGQKFACLSGQKYKIHKGLVPIHELPDDHGQRRYVGEPSLSEDDSSEDDSDDANDNGGSLVENGKPCTQV